MLRELENTWLPSTDTQAVLRWETLGPCQATERAPSVIPEEGPHHLEHPLLPLSPPGHAGACIEGECVLDNLLR